MDDQKKQKVLLAVLGVLALGAGSYFVLFRESDNTSQRRTSTGPVVRKERKVVTGPAKDVRKTRAKRETSRVTVQRQERSKRKSTVTRRQRRDKAKKAKKKKDDVWS